MPSVGTIGAMALGGGLQGLWSYNRDNYFFDVPLRQSRQFQLQNIGMARFALFREDLRDLCALTTEKVQNYFVVNTLKLGFIVSIYFNFDRIDPEGPSMSFAEQQINLIFSMTLMTAFFNLLTSIWFSTHAVMLAESFTTKLLVQACRVPWPSMGEVDRASTDARHFESDFAGAFRVPLLSDGAVRMANRFKRQATSTAGTEPQQEGPRHAAESPPEDYTRGRLPSDQIRGPLGLSILDIISGTIDAEVVAGVESSLEPHLKFYKLIRPAWAGFDLYGKIAMEIGTATLLSGLGFYALYYLREEGDGFQVLPGGWISFACLSVLAWYSLALDLQISFLKHVALVMPIFGSFAGTLIFLHLEIHNKSTVRKPDMCWCCWIGPVVIFLQAVWVQAISWCGAGFGGGWTTFWRATRYLNVLHLEEGPSAFQRDLPTLDRGSDLRQRYNTAINGSRLDVRTAAYRNWGSLSSSFMAPSSQSGASRPESVDDGTSIGGSEEDDSDSLSMDILQAFAAASPLLVCLGRVIDVIPLNSRKLEATVYEVRDRLYEASRAAGALPLGAGAMVTPGMVRSFWLVMRPVSKKVEPEVHWLDLGGVETEEAMESLDEPQVTLDELLEAARKIADVLFADSCVWTPRDMERLARYGGEPIPGVASFLGQFHHKGSRNNHFPGKVATFQYRIGVLMTSILWVCSCAWSIYLTARVCDVDMSGFKPVAGNRTSDLPQAFGTQIPLVLPRPWFMPTSLACHGSMKLLMIADGDVAFVGDPNGSAWRGPIQPCWGAELLSADFGPHDKLWLATSRGIQEVALDSDAGSRLCKSQPSDTGLFIDMLAIDSVPPPDSQLPGIALANGGLHALEADPVNGWRLAGRIGMHIKKTIVGLSLSAGHALVLDSLGVVFRFEALTGRWAEPLVLDRSHKWKGICALPEQRHFLTMGRPAHTRGERQLWRFSPPGAGEAGKHPGPRLF